MIREIVQVGDPVLRLKCEPVKEFNTELCTLLDDMKETLKKAQGAGLAAPQVGVPLRVCVVDVEEGYFEFINPTFIWQKGEQYGAEGCLSVKGKAGDVRRPDKVKVLFYDRKGNRYALVARGFFARACCHEIDHLDGVLYIDKADNVREDKD